VFKPFREETYCTSVQAAIKPRETKPRQHFWQLIYWGEKAFSIHVLFRKEKAYH